MKKLLALLLALAMIACLFVGCAGDTEKPSDEGEFLKKYVTHYRRVWENEQ